MTPQKFIAYRLEQIEKDFKPYYAQFALDKSKAEWGKWREIQNTYPYITDEQQKLLDSGMRNQNIYLKVISGKRKYA